MDDRFWDNVDIADDCWEWQRSCRTSGYGQYSTWKDGKRVKNWLAHRYAYEQVVGPIPEGLEIDHLCRNRRCVNPDHLEPVTRSVNQQRSWRYITVEEFNGRQ
jgi:hypothetical protein